MYRLVIKKANEIGGLRLLSYLSIYLFFFVSGPYGIKEGVLWIKNF